MSQDFYTEEVVSFPIEDKEQKETEQLHETDDTTKHEQETGSFMTGQESTEPETPHPSTHEEESGSFITNTESGTDKTEETENEETIVASVYLPSITMTDTPKSKRFGWTPCNSLKLDYEKTGKYVVAGLSVCVAGYVLTRILRH